MDEFNFTHIFMDTSITDQLEHIQIRGDPGIAEKRKQEARRIFENSPSLKVFICTTDPIVFARDYNDRDFVLVHQTNPIEFDFTFTIYYYLKKGAGGKE